MKKMPPALVDHLTPAAKGDTEDAKGDTEEEADEDTDYDSDIY